MWPREPLQHQLPFVEAPCLFPGPPCVEKSRWKVRGQKLQYGPRFLMCLALPADSNSSLEGRGGVYGLDEK